LRKSCWSDHWTIQFCDTVPRAKSSCQGNNPDVAIILMGRRHKSRVYRLTGGDEGRASPGPDAVQKVYDGSGDNCRQFGLVLTGLCFSKPQITNRGAFPAFPARSLPGQPAGLQLRTYKGVSRDIQEALIFPSQKVMSVRGAHGRHFGGD
jgi:hypothetical protein